MKKRKGNDKPVTDIGNLIGKNIREVRYEKKLSQKELAEKCGFSNTVLSAYERGDRTPGLITLATIAINLGVNIDRLYFGDENEAFITAVPDMGRKIVNAIYYLWSIGAINYISFPINSMPFYSAEVGGEYIYVLKYSASIKRLIESLNTYKQNEKTFDDPEKYIEILLSSVANEINNSKNGE